MLEENENTGRMKKSRSIDSYWSRRISQGWQNSGKIVFHIEYGSGTGQMHWELVCLAVSGFLFGSVAQAATWLVRAAEHKQFQLISEVEDAIWLVWLPLPVAGSPWAMGWRLASPFPCWHHSCLSRCELLSLKVHSKINDIFRIIWNFEKWKAFQHGFFFFLVDITTFLHIGITTPWQFSKGQIFII